MHASATVAYLFLAPYIPRTFERWLLLIDAVAGIVFASLFIWGLADDLL